MFKRSLCKMWFNVKRQIVITPPVVEKPKEKVQEFSYFLVRSEQFKSSFWPTKLINWCSSLLLKNQMIRTIQFSRKVFEQSILEKYNTLIVGLANCDENDIKNLINPDLWEIIEMELKNYRMSNLNILSRHIATKATKEEIQTLGLQTAWDLKLAKSAALTQIKKAVNNPLDYAKINEWYQIVVKFTSEDGEKRYHIVEMNRKGTGWKFIRFDG